MVLVKKIAWFLSDCAWDVAWEFVPNFVSIPYKFSEKFYRHFLAAGPETQCELLQNIKELSDKEVDRLVRYVVDDCQERAGNPLSDNMAHLVHELILALRAAGSQSPPARVVAETVRNSINVRLKGLGEKAISQIQMAPEQKIIGQFVTISIVHRQKQQGKTDFHAQLPTIPGYQMLRPLGRGGFATVYLACHEGTGHLRAIKVGNLDDPRRLHREMAILQSVEHPNLVRYFEHGEQSGGYWIAMDYLGECNLADLIANGKMRPDWKQAICLGQEILRGLAALHDKQIMHRDLKPANVMVDAEFRVRLIDFGLAKSFDRTKRETSRVTLGGDLMGTPQYMSPEQVKGEPNLTLATDIWSFGVTMYELLVGEALFQGANVAVVWHDILTEKVNVNVEDIPVEFRSFFRRCLNRDASQRFASATEASAEFSRISNGLERRLQFERNRDKWIVILKNRLLEDFAMVHHGEMPPDCFVLFRAYCSKRGIDGNFDQVRLQEILPTIFACQASIEATRRQLDQSKQNLRQELPNLSSAQIHNWNNKNAGFEREIEAGPTTVRAEVHRLLAAEVATWEENLQLEAEERLLEAEEKRRIQQRFTEILQGISISFVGGIIGLLAGLILFVPVWVIIGTVTWNSNVGMSAASVVWFLSGLTGVAIGVFSGAGGASTSKAKTYCVSCPVCHAEHKVSRKKVGSDLWKVCPVCLSK